MQYASEPALTLAIGSSGFVQKSISVALGQTVRLNVKDTTGTGSGKLTFESKDLGIPQMTLSPGESQVIQWTAPGAPTDLTATTSKGPNTSMTVSVKPTQAAASSSAAATGGPRGQHSDAGQHVSITNLTAKVGETLACRDLRHPVPSRDSPTNCWRMGPIIGTTPCCAVLRLFHDSILQAGAGHHTRWSSPYTNPCGWWAHAGG